MTCRLKIIALKGPVLPSRSPTRGYKVELTYFTCTHKTELQILEHTVARLQDRIAKLKAPVTRHNIEGKRSLITREPRVVTRGHN